MIFRLTQKLNKKIAAGPLASLPLHESPWADWSARLFTVNRTQYILMSNTASLYSVVMRGRGTTGEGRFAERAMSAIHESMVRDGLEPAYTRVILPASDDVRFAKTLDRSVTGSMTDLGIGAKIYLAQGDMSPLEVGTMLNGTPMTAIGTPEEGGFATPRKAADRLPT